MTTSPNFRSYFQCPEIKAQCGVWCPLQVKILIAWIRSKVARNCLTASDFGPNKGRLVLSITIGLGNSTSTQPSFQVAQVEKLLCIWKVDMQSHIFQHSSFTNMVSDMLTKGQVILEATRVAVWIQPYPTSESMEEHFWGEPYHPQPGLSNACQIWPLIIGYHFENSKARCSVKYPSHIAAFLKKIRFEIESNLNQTLMD